MKILNRKEHVEKKPVYCWTSAVVIEVSTKELTSAIQSSFERSMNESERNNLIWSKCSIVDFKIIRETDS